MSTRKICVCARTSRHSPRCRQTFARGVPRGTRCTRSQHVSKTILCNDPKVVLNKHRSNRKHALLDDTLTIVSLESQRSGHPTQTSRGEHTQNRTPQRVRMGCQEVSGVVHSARLCATSHPEDTWKTTTKHFNACSFQIRWNKQILLAYKNLHFIEFVTGTVMPSSTEI